MDRLMEFLTQVGGYLDTTLFTLGGNPVTIRSILLVTVGLIALVVISGRLAKAIATALTRFTDVDAGVRQSFVRITRYVVVAFGTIIIVQAAGVDLSALTVLAGAAGVGIGFGLQNIINNFLSGLIILFERPIKVGDRVDVGGVHGDVRAISARSTTVVTNENIAIIVPNSEFISSKVTNWSYTDRRVRFDVPVGVAYGSDPERISKLLLGVARQHSGVLDQPPPEVLFEEFGDSSLNFTLQVWTATYGTRPRVLRSDLNFAIARTFTEHDVEIPFPQRDVHIRSGLTQGQ